MKRILKYSAAAMLMGLSMTGCKKDYLETAPTNAVPLTQVFNEIGAFESAINGTYRGLFSVGANGRHDNFGQKAYDLAIDLMGNDMVVHSAGYGWFNAAYQYTEWTFVTVNRHPDNAWLYYYGIIGEVNLMLEALNNFTGAATQAQKDQIRGEALGLRAFAYFNLINLYQQTYKGNETKPGVPLTISLSAEPKGRGTVQDAYTQIIADLTAAEQLLEGKAQIAKTRMDVRVVQGFRARTALIMEDWATAATYANKARQGRTPMTAAQYQDGFTRITNPEWMWGSEIPAAQATIYASLYSHLDIFTQGYAYLGGQKKITKELYDLIPAGDVRKNVFNAPANANTDNPAYNQLKFRVPNPGSWAADYLLMRAGEMYLIEAEALARQGQDGPARTVLQTLIQARNPAYSAASFSGTALINEILLQRRIELWGEGFALLDIKRLKQGLNRPTGAGNHGAPSLNPAVYTTGVADARMIMKIPQREIDANPMISIADQNP